MDPVRQDDNGPVKRVRIEGREQEPPKFFLGKPLRIGGREKTAADQNRRAIASRHRPRRIDSAGPVVSPVLGPKPTLQPLGGDSGDQHHQGDHTPYARRVDPHQAAAQQCQACYLGQVIPCNEYMRGAKS